MAWMFVKISSLHRIWSVAIANIFIRLFIQSIELSVGRSMRDGFCRFACASTFHSYSKKKHVDNEIQKISKRIANTTHIGYGHTRMVLFFSSFWMLKSFHRKLCISLNYVRHWPDFLRITFSCNSLFSISFLCYILCFVLFFEKNEEKLTATQCSCLSNSA